MDVQRGDTVYYRGEVWEVMSIRHTGLAYDLVTIRRWDEDGNHQHIVTFSNWLQRVEQVR